MNSSVEQPTSSFDVIKWIVVTALVAAGVYGNHYFSDQSLLYRVIGLLALGAVAIVVALNTASGRDFWFLLRESRVEIRKVIWPTRQETLYTTGIVLFVVLVAGLLTFGLDLILNWIISSVLG
jgi:preprotein translocase subunit SecE